MCRLYFSKVGATYHGKSIKNEVASMNNKRVGQRTIALAHPPSVISFANIGGKFEKQGPLGEYFDEWNEDSFFGEKTW